eukprot:3892912-Pyramimonas_sp.AAC.1
MVYDIITKLYAVAFCASLSNMAATVKAALHDVMREDVFSDISGRLGVRPAALPPGDSGPRFPRGL